MTVTIFPKSKRMPRSIKAEEVRKWRRDKRRRERAQPVAIDFRGMIELRCVPIFDDALNDNWPIPGRKK